jgi:hypothetical protein
MSRAERLAKYSEGLRILALDPSSTACGWAVFDAWPAELVDFNVIRGGGRKEPLERIDRMKHEVATIAQGFLPDIIVIEVTKGKHYGRDNHRPGMGVCGIAQGCIRERLICKAELLTDIHDAPLWRVQTVPDITWTHRTPKAKRAVAVGLKYPTYGAWAGKPGRDRGLDVADAIGLGDWWLSKRQIGSLMKGDVA